MSIIVLGTVALDNIQAPFGIRKLILGGSASHFSMTARLFTKVNLVAVVGKDFPKKYLKFLNGKGVNLDSVEINQGATFKWSGQYEGDLNTAITLKTELGVLAGFKPKVNERQKYIKHVFLANVDPHIQRHFLNEMHSPSLVGLDTMNFWIKHERKPLLRILKSADIFMVNEQEARSLSGEVNLIKAGRCLYHYGPKMILIKKGEHGVLFFSNKFIFALPAYPLEKVIDPTGAGDSFAGAFMGYLAKAKKINPAAIRKALAYATVAASFNVEGFGVERTARLNFRDLEARLEKFRQVVLF